MSRHGQLELFSTKDFAAENARLSQRLDDAKVAFRELRAALKQTRGELLDCARERADLQMEVQTLQRATQRLLAEKAMLELKVLLAQAERPARRGPTRDDLTKLLLLAHPDRWSQGQPATVLAHELSVVINQLRARAQA